MEQDMTALESVVTDFVGKYDTPEKRYLIDGTILLDALNEYEILHRMLPPKPLLYLFYRESIDSDNSHVHAKNALYSQRAAKLNVSLQFFQLSLGAIPAEKQQEYLSDPRLSRFRFLLECVFSDAKHKLSQSEEKMLALKQLPAKDLWISHNQKLLNARQVSWKGKTLPLAEAMGMIAEQKTAALRQKLAMLVYAEIDRIATFSEGEINAVFTDKKIEDELRGFDVPYEDTVREYRNDPAVVERLVKTVTEAFPIAHRFHALKARLLKQKRLGYWDRAAKIGQIETTFTFEESVRILVETFGALDKKYADYLEAMVRERRIDVYPRKGKRGGAYCSGSYPYPTFILLNHVDTYRSFTTLAHELGHSFHSELSKSQGPIYTEYSYSLAETASTLFESIASDAVFETLSKKDQIIALHDRIGNDVATIFRQIACFNFELDLHEMIRSKGYASKEDIAALHNKHMLAYLGPKFSMIPEDGSMFASWSHIRRFFYVYSYAYGMIVTKALLRRYRQDKSYWKEIEKFLSAGGKDTPENILKEIGVDVSSPEFFKEGLKAIEEDIERLERLVKA